MNYNKTNISVLPLLKVVMLALVIFPLLVGCGSDGSIHKTLLRAEAAMEENPDSAFNMLDTLHIEADASDDVSAGHALLLVQAMHKTNRLNHISPDSLSRLDAMLTPAVEYFEEKNDRQRLIKAYFYKGLLGYLREDSFENAVYPVSKSLNLSFHQNDNYWIGRNYDLLSEIYRRGRAYSDQAAAQRKALQYYELCGKKDFITFSRYSLAEALYNAGKYNDAIKMADSLFTDGTEETSPLGDEALNIKARACFFNGDYKQCAEIIEKLDSNGMHQNDLLLYQAASYFETDRKALAKEIMNQADAEDLDSTERNILEYLLKSDVSDQKRQDEILLSLYKNLLSDYKSVICKNFNEVQMMINRDADFQNDNERSALRNRYGIWIIVLVIILVVALVCLHIYREKHSAVKAYADEADSKLAKTHRHLLNADLKLHEKCTQLDESNARLHEANREVGKLQTSLVEREKDMESLNIKNAELQNELNSLIEKFSSSDPNINPIAKYEMDLSLLARERDELRKNLDNTNRYVNENTLEYLQNINYIISRILHKCSGEENKNEFISGALKRYLDSFDIDKGNMKEWEDKLDAWTRSRT